MAAICGCHRSSDVRDQGSNQPSGEFGALSNHSTNFVRRSTVMKKLFGTRKRIVAIGVTGAVLVGAVAAYAFFTAAGSGTGSAKTATSATLTVKQIGAGYDTII